MRMKLWFRKLAVILITIMTLGIYVPPIPIHTEINESKNSVEPSPDVSETAHATVDRDEVNVIEPELPTAESKQEEMIQLLTEKAREQTITKLGPRIMEQVDQEFNEAILPTIEYVLQSVLTEEGDSHLPYYGITEHPAGGLGEKIFHVYDVRTHQDLARFHVRRDNRPLEGYWFNFHYHLSQDNFEAHHEIGEIYWNKNTPPQWMA